MRVGVFCFYDSDGKVDKYVEYLLLELKKVINELHIVVNGKVDDAGKLIFLKYTNNVYIRENRGFDAGAYKEAITKFIGLPKIKEFDELVLCNDTFFGPFVSFKKIFAQMKQHEVDFWGLKYVDDSFFSHLQSYFLVFRKKILKEDILFQYIEENINSDTKDIAEIYATFERGLFYKLKEAGYTYAAYTNSINCDDYRSGNYSIKSEGLPLLKKKVFDKKYYVKDNAVEAIELIKNSYDIGLIRDTVQRKYGYTILEKQENMQTVLYKIPTMKVTEQDVIDFSKTVKKVYIYGTGVVATSIYYFFGDKISAFEGFIISDGEKKKRVFKDNLKVYYMNELQLDDEVGIIIALNPENSKEVQKNVKSIKKTLYLWKM